MNDLTVEAKQDFINHHSYLRKYEYLHDLLDDDLINELEKRGYICLKI